jgi:DNA mismatch repair protein MutS
VKRSGLDTPMMRHFLSVKAKHSDAIVFYRMGDFYEMFLADAELAAPLLDIALTTRDRGVENPVPMCGVPVHSADVHIKRLASLGHRVAICEQVEDARAASGRRLVRRDVVEVVTPGLVGDPENIEAARELALVAIEPGPAIGFAVLEASTGDLRATQVEGRDGAGLPPALVDELQRVDPREILLPAGADPAWIEALAALLPAAARSDVEVASFDPAQAPVHPHGLSATATDPGSRAAAALLAYLGANQPFALTQVSRLRDYRLADSMVLDAVTRRNLELFRSMEDGSRRYTLVERLDRTTTPLGARRLARWIAYPLIEPAGIRSRQQAVTFLADRDRPRARLREAMRRVRDLERQLAKVARPTATPRDLAGLRGSLEALPAVVAALGDAQAAAPWEGEGRPLLELPGNSGCPLQAPEPVPEVAELLREALVDEPRVVLRGSRGAGETGYIRDGFHSELDAVRQGAHKGRESIAGLETLERERTGISNLKVRFHPVHGYSIEVTKANLGRVPPDYERKQTLANAERFTTADLREVERSVLGANERAAALERELFESLRQSTLERAEAIRRAADRVADLDATASLAEVARLDGWVCPEVDASETVEIRGGRHPVVEPILEVAGGEQFVPNDTDLDPSAVQILVLTGPNMSGKSTYLRQVALIVLLAQMGSFVPAARARIGVVDRVFTRVGATDRLARGESTFMVEMRETADILAQASRRSLVVLDEIGRGTSTFDGLSIAWAVAEYLHDTPGLGARTLFATHYHELADLARTKPRVRNAHFEAREWDDRVIFLRRLVEGAANRSYGIQVARLAGLPPVLIERAREILHNLEGSELDEEGRPRLAEVERNLDSHGSGLDTEPDHSPGQLGLFGVAPVAGDPRDARVLEALRRVEPDHTTPIEALEVLSRLVSELGPPRREGES